MDLDSQVVCVVILSVFSISIIGSTAMHREPAPAEGGQAAPEIQNKFELEAWFQESEFFIPGSFLSLWDIFFISRTQNVEKPLTAGAIV